MKLANPPPRVNPESIVQLESGDWSVPVAELVRTLGEEEVGFLSAMCTAGASTDGRVVLCDELRIDKFDDGRRRMMIRFEGGMVVGPRRLIKKLLGMRPLGRK